MKKIFILMIALILGCAKVSVEAKKPIKLDIQMRVDIYQHIVNDVESINDQIYGTEEKSFNPLFMLEEAYAADFSPQVTEAILRRKERKDFLEGYFASGYIGQDKDAFLQVRGDIPEGLRSEVDKVISEENKDRDLIYRATAVKNGTNVSEVSKIFFQADYKRAPSGYWFEVYKDGKYVWLQK